MSIASTWDEKLKAQNPRDANGYHVGYQDIRALVDDALELERLGQVLSRRPALEDLPDATAKVEKAISTAKQADRLRAELEAELRRTRHCLTGEIAVVRNILADERARFRAQDAAMREALTWVLDYCSKPIHETADLAAPEHVDIFENARAALAPTAGTDYEQRIRAEERERCACIAEDFAARRDILPPHIVEQWRKHLDGLTLSNTASERSRAIAAAIRATGGT